MIHPKDVCTGIVKILEQNKGDDYLVCNSENAQMKELVIKLFKLHNIKITESGNIESNTQNILNELKEIEVNIIGEGVVYKNIAEDGSVVQFKVKGEKHAGKSKVKTLQIVDVEKLNSIKEFVDYAVTEGRLKQGIEKVFTMNGEDIDIKKMGQFLKWIMADIVAEEMDTLKENSLEPKNVGKFVSNKARNWFLEKWNKI
jgi:GDP-D-mannose dehydratase